MFSQRRVYDGHIEEDLQRRQGEEEGNAQQVSVTARRGVDEGARCRNDATEMSKTTDLGRVRDQSKGIERSIVVLLLVVFERLSPSFEFSLREKKRREGGKRGESVKGSSR